MKRNLILGFLIIIITSCLLISLKKHTVTVKRSVLPDKTDTKIYQDNEAKTEFNFDNKIKEEDDKENQEINFDALNLANDNKLGKSLSVTQNKKIEQSNQKIQTNLDKKLKMCIPYSEYLSTDFLGLNMDYKINILGWISGKCVIDFDGNFKNFNINFKEIYGITPDEAEVKIFTPHIRCEFTKNQLQYVGDSILEEVSRENNPSKRMLKDPKEVELPDFENLSDTDLRLIEILMKENACYLKNAGI